LSSNSDYGDYKVQSIVLKMYYSNQEMADKHFMYGHANKNASAAQLLYAEKFLNRRIAFF